MAHAGIFINMAFIKTQNNEMISNTCTWNLMMNERVISVSYYCVKKQQQKQTKKKKNTVYSS